MTKNKCPQCENNKKDLQVFPLEEIKCCSVECYVDAITNGFKPFNELENFLFCLRMANMRVMLPLFTNGQCFQLFNIVKLLFKDAELWTDDCHPPAHAYIKWKDDFYDITGKIDPDKLKDIPINPAKKKAIPLFEDDRYLWYPRTKKFETDARVIMTDPNFYLDKYINAKKIQTRTELEAM